MTESHVLCIAFYSCLLSIRLPVNTSPLFYNPVYVADCGPPSFFPNGTVIYQNITEGSQAHYHCNSGFTLEGNSTAVCGAGGNWSSKPVCGKSESGTTYEANLSHGTCMINNSICLDMFLVNIDRTLLIHLQVLRSSRQLRIRYWWELQR